MLGNFAHKKVTECPWKCAAINQHRLLSVSPAWRQSDKPGMPDTTNRELSIQHRVLLLLHAKPCLAIMHRPALAGCLWWLGQAVGQRRISLLTLQSNNETVRYPVALSIPIKLIRENLLRLLYSAIGKSMCYDTVRVQPCIDTRGHHFKHLLKVHSDFPNTDL
jgi:hypothetical protein